MGTSRRIIGTINIHHYYVIACVLLNNKRVKILKEWHEWEVKNSLAVFIF